MQSKPITAAQGATPLVPAAIEVPAPVARLTVPIARKDPSAAAIPLSLRTAPLPRAQSLVAPGRSVVARIVTWLTKLAPRKKRSALAKPRTTLRTPLVRRELDVCASPATVRMTVAADDAMTRRMMLELSEENARLRRELEALRLSPLR